MQSPMMWHNPWTSDGRILMESEPLKVINQYRQDDHLKPEAGGILLGYRRDKHLHIVLATVPQIGDQRRRFWFSRSSKFHQQVATQKWGGSLGTMDYLGEWHTHPELSPTPSSLDLSEWRTIYRQRSNSMFFMILGLSGELWVGLSDCDDFKPCKSAPLEYL